VLHNTQCGRKSDDRFWESVSSVTHCRALTRLALCRARLIWHGTRRRVGGEVNGATGEWSGYPACLARPRNIRFVPTRYCTGACTVVTMRNAKFTFQLTMIADWNCQQDVPTRCGLVRELVWGLSNQYMDRARNFFVQTCAVAGIS
jgi:hypothetical protein